MLRFAAIAASFFVIVTFGSVHADTQYPLILTDDLGHTITLTQEPEKVSSKTLFTDEVLLSILPSERLSSVTNYAKDAGYSNVADRVPVTVPLLDLNVEHLLSNMPDIVFAANWSDSGKIEQLRRIGIPVYQFNTPTRWEDIQTTIRKIGWMLNVEAMAEQLIEERNQQLATLIKQKQKIATHQLVALDYNSWGTSSGVNTTWHAVLELAGIINGSAQFEQGAFGQVEMSKELIITVNPDILFLPGWMTNQSTEAQAFYQHVINDPALANVNAIQNGRVYPVPGHLRGTYSHYLIDAVSFVIDAVAADL